MNRPSTREKLHALCVEVLWISFLVVVWLVLAWLLFGVKPG